MEAVKTYMKAVQYERYNHKQNWSPVIYLKRTVNMFDNSPSPTTNLNPLPRGSYVCLASVEDLRKQNGSYTL